MGGRQVNNNGNDGASSRSGGASGRTQSPSTNREPANLGYKEFAGLTVTTDSGDKIQIDDKLDDGGAEGAIYETASSDAAIKIFDQRDSTETASEAKLKRMIEYVPDDELDIPYNVFVWPEAVIYYRGDFVGYKMPLLDTSAYSELKPYIKNELSEGLTPKKLKLAYHLATTVYVVHGLGHAVGDFNYENILVQNGQLKLIDCDSYSIDGVGDDEYHGNTMYDETIPPEARPKGDMHQAQMADSFNLAVWIFRIISGNWYTPYANPYQAKGKLAVGGDIVEMMEENPYPFWDPQPGVLEPVYGQDLYDDLPVTLRFLFESAFLGGKFHPYKRPSPAVWRRVLMSLLENYTSDSIPNRDVAKVNSELITHTKAGQSVDLKSLPSDDPIAADYYDTVRVAGTVVAVKPLTSFENSEGETDYVSTVKLETKSGTIDLTFWNKQGIVAARSLFPGVVLEAEGEVRPSKYQDREREIYVDDFDIELKYDNYNPSLNDLSAETYDLHLRGTIVGIQSLTSFERNGEQRHVTNVVIADQSGHATVTLWGEMGKRVADIPVGLTLEIVDGYCKTDDRGRKDIKINEDMIPPVLTDIDVDYTLDTDEVSAATPGDVVDVTGQVDTLNNGEAMITTDGVSLSVDTKDLLTNYDVEQGDTIFLSNIVIKKTNPDYRGFIRNQAVVSILS